VQGAPLGCAEHEVRLGVRLSSQVSSEGFDEEAGEGDCASRGRGLGLAEHDPPANLAACLGDRGGAAQQAADPVLAQLTHYIARDEFQHTKISQDLLGQRIEAGLVDPEDVLQAAADFSHYGTSAVDEVPVFQRNDLQAIKSYMKKVRDLTGTRLVDHLKATLMSSPGGGP